MSEPIERHGRSIPVPKLARAAAAWLAAVGHSLAAAAAGMPQGQPPGPPPEAVAACVGKTEGTRVSFTGRHGNAMSGTCRLHGTVLAARPDMPPPGSGVSAPFNGR